MDLYVLDVHGQCVAGLCALDPDRAGRGIAAVGGAVVAALGVPEVTQVLGDLGGVAAAVHLCLDLEHLAGADGHGDGVVAACLVVEDVSCGALHVGGLALPG